MPPNPAAHLLGRARTRSFGYFDFEGDPWACYLVTYRRAQRRWCGYLAFRPKDDAQTGEVRTVDLFIESDEAEIERRARSLGRPLLSGLLASAMEVKARSSGPRLRGWVNDAIERERDLEVRSNSRASEPEAALRMQYATYRLDQITHLVGLIDVDEFEAVVSAMLDAEPYSFRSQDRLQFAMLFVQKLEPLLPLPPFSVFAVDFQTHESEYHRYHHGLHSGPGIGGL